MDSLSSGWEAGQLLICTYFSYTWQIGGVLKASHIPYKPCIQLALNLFYFLRVKRTRQVKVENEKGLKFTVQI